jgi:CHAD domain-containing protein
MWIEFVPMSMAAMRMQEGLNGRGGQILACYMAVIYCEFGRIGRNPIMNGTLPLVRLLERRTRALKRHLAAAVKGDGIGVHQARVASRRLREAVPVLSEGLHGAKAGKATRKIRRLTRALGAVRELDVTLHLIDELGAKPGVPRPALAEVRAHVIEAREKRRAVMHDRLEGVDIDKLAKRLASVRDALAKPSPDHNWRTVLASRIASRGRRLVDAIAEAGQIYGPEALHRVRIATKKLRYAMELADESGAAPAARIVRTLRKAQDTLGRLHDLQVLQHYGAEVSAAPHGPNSADAGLAMLARLIEDECRRLHGRYVAMVPELSAAVDSARRDVVMRLRVPARARSAKMLLGTRRRTKATDGRTSERTPARVRKAARR